MYKRQKKVMETAGVKESVVVMIVTLAGMLSGIEVTLFGISLLEWFLGIIGVIIFARVIVTMVCDLFIHIKTKVKEYKA